MIEKIYSLVEPKKVLHLVHRSNRNSQRNNLIPEENYLQCAYMCLPKGKTFLPHKHIERERSFTNMIPQESWLVIKGAVKCIFYDLNDTILCERVLNAGDASFTLYGGHNYEILEDDTLIYEYKTGPYEGIELDKTMIGE